MDAILFLALGGNQIVSLAVVGVSFLLVFPLPPSFRSAGPFRTKWSLTLAANSFDVSGRPVSAPARTFLGRFCTATRASIPARTGMRVDSSSMPSSLTTSNYVYSLDVRAVPGLSAEYMCDRESATTFSEPGT